MTFATSRASPSMASPNMRGVTPAARATSAAASSEAWGAEIISMVDVASRGSPGFGDSDPGFSRWPAIAGGGVIPYFSSTALASARLVGSGTVGPDAMVAGSSPGTSEISRLTTCAGCAAAASRPPLMAERCLRRQFISEMSAPERSNSFEIACLSSSVSPSAGSASSAEPPPDIRQSNKSSGPSPEASSRIRPAASRPDTSGTGCAASMTSIRSQGTAWS